MPASSARARSPGRAQAMSQMLEACSPGTGRETQDLVRSATFRLVLSVHAPCYRTSTYLQTGRSCRVKPGAVECIEAATGVATAAAEVQGLSQVFEAKTPQAQASMAPLLPADFKVVVLNPARNGAGAAVMQQVLRWAPKSIAHISCNPDLLARDISGLGTRGSGSELGATGYDVRTVTPLAPFPHTRYIETVLLVGLEYDRSTHLPPRPARDGGQAPRPVAASTYTQAMSYFNRLLVIGGMVVVGACGSPTEQLSLRSFEVSPANPLAGEVVSIFWEAEGADSCQITGLDGPLDPVGFRQVRLVADQTFQITCRAGVEDSQVVSHEVFVPVRMGAGPESLITSPATEHLDIDSGEPVFLQSSCLPGAGGSAPAAHQWTIDVGEGPTSFHPKPIVFFVKADSFTLPPYAPEEISRLVFIDKDVPQARLTLACVDDQGTVDATPATLLVSINGID